ncbi:OmpH family outer membrane protein [Candidatus Pelagibacter sp.]|jgi:Skp family chaperone for outer membrane proteins|nr:OmpH family outer membrane protein [Candidatus Pelagibacter sp.]
MNFFKKLITITIALLLNFSLSHSEEQIVYLDLDTIVGSTKAGKLIISNLEKSKKSTLVKFEKREKELKKIENDINKQKNILSEEELKKKLIEFRKEINTFQNNRQNVINDFNKKKIEEFNNFFKKITPIIQNYVSEKNIDIVLDRKNIFVASKKKDITKEIIKLIDSKIK